MASSNPPIPLEECIVTGSKACQGMGTYVKLFSKNMLFEQHAQLRNIIKQENNAAKAYFLLKKYLSFLMARNFFYDQKH